MSFQVGQRGLSLKKGFSVDVIFENVAGLNKDASVQIAGVEVGRVQSIKLQDGRALVTLRITPEVKLEKDVTAAIKTHGVLGDKYIEITPGTKGQALLKPGENITLTERHADVDRLLNQMGLIADDIKILTGSLSKVVSGQKGELAIGDIIENTRQLTYNLNTLVKNNEQALRATLENTRELTSNLNKIVSMNEEALRDTLKNTRDLTGNLNKVVATNEEALRDTLNNTRNLTSSLNNVVTANEEVLRDTLKNTRDLAGNLNKVVANNDAKITEVLDGLKGASREMEKTFASLGDISEGMKKGEGSVGQLLQDKTVADRLNKTLASLQEVADKINQGRGTIGKLVNEEETVNNINQGLAGINRYVNKAEQFRTFLGYRGEYLFNKSSMKSYLDVKIQPTVDKFYLLGVASDPRGKRTVKETTIAGVTTTVEENDKQGLLFTAQIGKRFNDLVLRGGLFESTGGFGLDYMAFNDKLKLTFEAFDFADDRRTHLKAAAEYRFFKYLYVSAGWDDFISNQGNSSPFAGLSIRFEDEDIKYLLTSTPIPK